MLLAHKFYSSILASISLAVNKWSILATRYNVVLLLSTFAVYVARDVWPLVTFSEHPRDLSEGQLLWFKVATLTITAVLIPLFIPRRYIPVDPKAIIHPLFVYLGSDNYFQNPMSVPNDEQTCSIFSRCVYTYLDPVISLGYRVSHLQFDQLPPLPDSDECKNLINIAFPVCLHVDVGDFLADSRLKHLDVYQGAKRRHLFFGLMRVLREQ